MTKPDPYKVWAENNRLKGEIERLQAALASHHDYVSTVKYPGGRCRCGEPKPSTAPVNTLEDA
jgi:hypothetical protein